MLNSARRTHHHDTSVETIPAAPTYFSICYTPRPGSPLARFGRSWLGRAQAGQHGGLHAPFFAPSRLRETARLDDVRAHLQRFAAHRKPIETGPLTLACVRRALVLRPAEPRPELDWLALQCFNAFDTYAAASDSALAEHPHLSPHQRLLLKSFGQPNVMSEYRFQLTLTGPLDDRQRARVLGALRPLVAELCAAGTCVDGLSLTGATRPAVHDRVAFGPLTDGPSTHGPLTHSPLTHGPVTLGPVPGHPSERPMRVLGRYALAG